MSLAVGAGKMDLARVKSANRLTYEALHQRRMRSNYDVKSKRRMFARLVGASGLQLVGKKVLELGLGFGELLSSLDRSRGLWGLR